jgi:hypothetical protein
MVEHYHPPFVTETDEPPSWNDCQWCAGLMLANKATRGRYPSTRSEREALREASGDYMGGSSFHDLARGYLRRYGKRVSLNAISVATLERRLLRGDGADVNLIYNALPDHFTRWDRRFAAKGRLSRHAAYVQATDRGGNFHLTPDGRLRDVFWNDPLGRSPTGTPPTKRYRGEWMPWPVLVRSLVAFTGSSSAVSVLTLSEGAWL